MKLSSLKIDSARAEAGAWVDDIPGLPGVRLKVRWLQSLAVQKARSTLFLEMVPAERRAAPTEEDKARVAALVLADAVLLDWDGLEDEDGAPLAYDRDRAAVLITDPDYRILADAVVYAASVVQRAEAEARAADEKN